MKQCRTRAFTCIDCSVTFDLASVQVPSQQTGQPPPPGHSPPLPQGHTSCVTEHEKYALLATKPGGGGAAAAAAAGTGGPSGTQFLATQPPWLCSCCHVTCTSVETLAGHAAGKKHRSKARAAEAAAAPKEGAPAEGPAAKRPREEAEPEAAAAAGVRVKWRRVAGEVLRGAPGGRLTAGALRDGVLAAVAAQHGAAAGDAAALAAAYAAEVAGSNRFRANAEGLVTLRADA